MTSETRMSISRENECNKICCLRPKLHGIKCYKTLWNNFIGRKTYWTVNTFYFRARFELFLLLMKNPLLTFSDNSVFIIIITEAAVAQAV
jgi:hypothetical protein